MARALILTHRYLGMAVGLLMVLWCLSGMVMMYVPYPQLTEDERVQHLQPIDWSRCCLVDSAQGAVAGFQVEMLGSRLISRATPIATAERRSLVVIDLATGSSVSSISQNEAAEVAAALARAGQPAATHPAQAAATHPVQQGAAAHLVGLVPYDQWTVQGRRSPDRPLFRFSLNDESRTEIYVSAVTGMAVQKTTAAQRFWNWLGAIPHWLYFTPLRANGELWSQVVIWMSLVGAFLTVTGIYVGLKQLKRRSSGRWIPYNGFQYWHHAIGLVFGLFVLTWVVSGLISMNPWGFLEGEGFDEPSRLRGAPLSMTEVNDSLDALARSSVITGVVQVQSAPLAGKLFMVVTRADGTRIRLDAQANPTPLSAIERVSIASTLAGQGYSLERLEQEDEYYFTHHREHARLPAYRVTASDSGRTRYYLDPVSGEILQKVDRNNQWYRWLHQAPHRLDFSTFTRSRPLWDVLTLTLLGGSTMVCAIGAYLGLRRLTGR